MEEKQGLVRKPSQSTKSSEARRQGTQPNGLMLEYTSHPSVVCVDEMGMKSINDPEPDLDELIYLVGGYNGVLWLSALDFYSPITDVIKSLKPMNHGRAYVSIAWLNGELYVFGGGNNANLIHIPIKITICNFTAYRSSALS